MGRVGAAPRDRAGMGRKRGVSEGPPSRIWPLHAPDLVLVEPDGACGREKRRATTAPGQASAVRERVVRHRRVQGSRQDEEESVHRRD